jgi:histidyl-tRNA synthetase
VLVLDRERLADYQRMAAQLRNAGIAAEIYLGASGMKAQMKYADRRNSPLAIIQGSDEKARGEVTIMTSSPAATANIATNEQWKALRRPICRAEAELVEEVQKALKEQI